MAEEQEEVNVKIKKACCPHCGKVPYPVKNPDGSFNWKNFLRVDFFTILIVALIIFSAWAYKHDTEQCFDIMAEPQLLCTQGWCEAYYNSEPFCKQYCYAQSIVDTVTNQTGFDIT